jgi:hypothetical protein
MTGALSVLVVLALLFAVLAIVVAGVVAARFVALWRGLRRMHKRFVFLEQTRGDARREINRTALRVAALEHAAGVAPPSEYRDLRKVRPVDFEADELADELAEADETGHLRKLGDELADGVVNLTADAGVPDVPARTPRLGDKVTVDLTTDEVHEIGGRFVDDERRFAGEVRGVDHVKKFACVMPPGGDWPETKPFAWERLHFVA